jgi:hypothetical protein
MIWARRADFVSEGMDKREEPRLFGCRYLQVIGWPTSVDEEQGL